MFSGKFIEIKDDRKVPVTDYLNKNLKDEIFDSQKCKILSHQISCYPNCSFIEVETSDSLDSRKFYLLKNDQSEDTYFLNGTNEPIYALNSDLPIKLDAENVISYTRFFFNYVRGSHGRFLIIDHPDDIKWREEPAQNAKKSLGKMIEPLSIIQNNTDDFVLHASIVFKDSLFEANIIVKNNGNVSLTRQEILVEDIPVLDDVFGQ